MKTSLTFHCGVPLGVPSRRIAQAVDGPLLALFNSLQMRPRLRIGLHLGGHIIDFLLRYRSERLVQLAGLSQGGQIELIGGGYYDPILCSLTEQAAAKHLARSSQFFSEQLRFKAAGAWLPEQVFEPGMVPLLAQAGYKYLFLPCDPIDAAGVESAALEGPLLLEQGGHKLLALAAEQGSEQVLVRDLERWVSAAGNGRQMLVWNGDLLRLSSDPQSWPKGPQIERFFADLDITGSLKYCCPASLAERAPESLLYPGPGSHREMGTWSLPVKAGRRRAAILRAAENKGAKEGLPLLAQGRWSSFLARYPEAGRMHSHALRCARRIGEAELPNYWQERMWTSLLQTQGHEAFQHAADSGIYNPLQRQAVHGRLADLDDYLDHLEAAASGDPKRLNLERSESFELLPDGTKGVTLSASRGHWTFCPERGGALVGLTLPGLPWDLLHAMPRYPETYDNLGKNDGPLWSLSDRFTKDISNLDEPDLIGDFSGLKYDSISTGGTLTMSVEGEIDGLGKLRVDKSIKLAHGGSELVVDLRIQAPQNQALRGFLLQHLYVSLPPSEANQLRLGETLCAWDEPQRSETDCVMFVAPSSRTQLALTLPFNVPTWTRPVRTEHRDRGVLRSSMQGVVVCAAIPLQLSSGSSWKGRLSLRALRRH